MSAESKAKRTWSLRRKLLIGIIALVVNLGLALGLGLGLTLGKDGNDGNGDNGAPALTPLPAPDTALPWTPKVNDSWQIILSHPPQLSPSAASTTPNVPIFDIDLFDTPETTIQQLHSLGKKVICYFSAGSYEDWRSDAKEFKNEDLGKQLDGWPGEKWLNLGSDNVRAIMKKRLEIAKEKGCDGVEPDNVDGYQNYNGLTLTMRDSISYVQFLSSIARPLNLTLGLKNAGSIVSAVLPLVDFSVNEQCAQYNECNKFQPFIASGKPVFHIEYPAGDSSLQQTVEANGFSDDTKKRACDAIGSNGFSTILKKMELDGWAQYCAGKVESTAIDQDNGGHAQRRKRR